MKTATGRWLGLTLLVSSILLSAVGQLCMKAGMHELHVVGNAWVDRVGPIVWTAGGLLAYVCSLMAWLAVLVRYPLSFAYPMLSLSYILVYIGAVNWPLLSETATPMRTFGTLLILVGVALVSLNARAEDNMHRGD